MSQDKTVIIAGQFSYPSGMAASARIRNLAHGFRTNGWKVKVIAMKSSMPNHQLGEYKEHDHIPFTYSSAVKEKSETKVQKIKRLFSPYRNMADHFKNRIESEKIDAVLLFGESYFLLNPIIKLAKKHSIPVMLDIVELYEHMFSMKDIFKDPFLMDGYLGTKLLASKVDMNLCITKALFDRFEGRAPITYLLPGIERIGKESNSVVRENGNGVAISYIGALYDRDAPDQIISFLKMLNDASIDYTFQVIGRYENHAKGKYHASQIKALAPDRVSCHSGLSDEELRYNLHNSDVLFLPRRNGITEVFSFPTRLVEYLKTEALILACGIGDIPHYLTHNENSFLYEDIIDIKDELISVLKDKSRILQIGKMNDETLKSHFDNVHHTKILIDKIDV